MNNTIQFNFKIFLFIILVLGVLRFIYAVNFKEHVSFFNSTYAEKVYHNSTQENNSLNNDGRQWGPFSIVLIQTIETIFPDKYTAAIWRVILCFSYLIIIYILFSLIKEFKSIFYTNQGKEWELILLFICFQFSGVIYSITNGGAEIITSLTILGHFYFFYKKKYFIASLFIVFGIYYKFHPIVFAFPFLIFSFFSQNHKNYFLYLIFTGLIFATLAYFIQGFKYGFFYPLAIVISVMDKSASVIPIWSEEVFSPLTLINKIINGFGAKRTSIFEISNLISFLSNIFTILLVITNAIIGFVLVKKEYLWENNDSLRFFHLFLFQAVIGFLYLMFSVDISLEHLPLIFISIFSPLFLFSSTINKFKDLDYFKIINIIIYFIGLIFIGALIPISTLTIIIPFDFFDSLVDYQTYNIGKYGRFIWYHIPLFGMLIVAFITYFYIKFFILKDKFFSKFL